MIVFYLLLCIWTNLSSNELLHLIPLSVFDIQLQTFLLRRFFCFQHYSGLEEAVIRNIDACKEMAKTTRSAYGPNGKAIILHVNITLTSTIV